MKRKSLAVAVLMTLVGPALAVTTSASFNAGATLSSTCKLSLAGNVDFGVIDFTRNNQASTQLNVICTKGTNFTVAMLFPANSQGGNNGVYSSGMMLPIRPGNGDFISYSIILPRGGYWGNTAGSDLSGTASVGVSSGIGNGLAQTYPIVMNALTVSNTGQAGVFITPDTYLDTTTVSVTY